VVVTAISRDDNGQSVKPSADDSSSSGSISEFEAMRLSDESMLRSERPFPWMNPPMLHRIPFENIVDIDPCKYGVDIDKWIGAASVHANIAILHLGGVDGLRRYHEFCIWHRTMRCTFPRTDIYTQRERLDTLTQAECDAIYAWQCHYKFACTIQSMHQCFMDGPDKCIIDQVAKDVYICRQSGIIHKCAKHSSGCNRVKCRGTKLLCVMSGNVVSEVYDNTMFHTMQSDEMYMPCKSQIVCKPVRVYIKDRVKIENESRAVYELYKKFIDLVDAYSRRIQQISRPTRIGTRFGSTSSFDSGPNSRRVATPSSATSVPYSPASMCGSAFGDPVLDDNTLIASGNEIVKKSSGESLVLESLDSQDTISPQRAASTTNESTSSVDNSLESVRGFVSPQTMRIASDRHRLPFARTRRGAGGTFVMKKLAKRITVGSGTKSDRGNSRKMNRNAALYNLVASIPMSEMHYTKTNIIRLPEQGSGACMEMIESMLRAIFNVDTAVAVNETLLESVSKRIHDDLKHWIKQAQWRVTKEMCEKFIVEKWIDASNRGAILGELCHDEFISVVTRIVFALIQMINHLATTYGVYHHNSNITTQTVGMFTLTFVYAVNTTSELDLILPVGFGKILKPLIPVTSKLDIARISEHLHRTEQQRILQGTPAILCSGISAIGMLFTQFRTTHVPEWEFDLARWMPFSVVHADPCRGYTRDIRTSRKMYYIEPDYVTTTTTTTSTIADDNLDSMNV